MKKLVLILLLLFSLKSMAQDPRLFENNWYLEKLILEGLDVISPQQNLVGEISFANTFFAVGHQLCEDYLVDIPISYTGDAFFELENGGFYLLGICSEPEIFDFMENHYTFYDPAIVDNNPFNYTLEELNNYLKLTINNGINNIAIYNSILLSNNTLQQQVFTIYPNPVSSILNIETEAQITKMLFYNLQGQEVLSVNDAIENIDVSFLSAGIYFIHIETQKGNVVKKLVKK